MHVNHDEQIVVLDRQMYDALRAFAEIGASELNREFHLKPILKHARRFNTALANEAAAARKQQRKMLLERIAYAKAVLRHCGKTLRVCFGRGSAVRVLGRSSFGPDYVRVRYVTSAIARPSGVDVLATTLILPEA